MLLNSLSWKQPYTFVPRREETACNNPKHLVHNTEDLNQNITNIEDLIEKSMDFTIYKVKSAKILWKSKDLLGFHGRILQII